MERSHLSRWMEAARSRHCNRERLSWGHVKPTIKLPVMMRSSYGATCGGVRSRNVVYLELSFHCESASLIIVSGQNVMQSAPS